MEVYDVLPKDDGNPINPNTKQISAWHEGGTGRKKLLKSCPCSLVFGYPSLALKPIWRVEDKWGWSVWSKHTECHIWSSQNSESEKFRQILGSNTKMNQKLHWTLFWFSKTQCAEGPFVQLPLPDFETVWRVVRPHLPHTKQGYKNNRYCFANVTRMCKIQVLFTGRVHLLGHEQDVFQARDFWSWYTSYCLCFGKPRWMTAFVRQRTLWRHVHQAACDDCAHTDIRNFGFTL